MDSSVFLNNLAVYVNDLAPFAAFSLALVCLVLPAGLVIVTFGSWRSPLFALVGAFAAMTARETAEVLLVYLRWSLIVSSVVFLVDFQAVHIAVLVLIALALCLVRLDPLGLLLDGVATVIATLGLMLFSAVGAYVATVRFDASLVVLEVVFGAVVVLLAVFYLQRDIRRFLARKNDLRTWHAPPERSAADE